MTALIARLADETGNYIQAIERLTVTTARSVIGGLAREKKLTSLTDDRHNLFDTEVERNTQMRAAAGRRSLVSLPKAGSPHRSPRLAPATSAEPSRESRAPTLAASRFATTCDGRPRPRFRGLSHQIAFFAAVPVAVAVALTTDGGLARVAGTAFALSVAVMFGISSMFHRGTWSAKAARRLGRLDHAMIYGVIAATYAPIGLLVVHRGWRLPILATVWGGACLAATVKLAWARAPTWVPAAISIALGWAAMIVLPQIARGIGLPGTFLLLAGGIAYSAGAVVYVRQRPNPAPATFGYHEVFHLLVIAAVVCQYSTIVFYVLPRA
jgi:hemolysin III